jgi:hypothetical protein
MIATMINWFSVVANSFWIVGLALILAAVSYFYWLAGQKGESFREEMGNLAFQRFVMGGLLLVGVGLALTAWGTWQVLPAVGLIFLCLAALLASFRDSRQRPRS